MFQEMKFDEVPQDVERIPFGIFELDKKGGYRTNDFIVLSANTGVGKSMVAQWIALKTARLGHKTMYVDYENDPQIVAERFNWFDASVNTKWHQLREQRTLIYCMKSVEENKIVEQIILGKTLNPIQFVLEKYKSIENAILLHKPKLLVIDLFSGIYKTVISAQQTSQVVYLLSEKISELAKEHRCAIIALEQIKGDSRNGVRPTPKDIATGQALTHKATKIITLFSYAKDNQARIASEDPTFPLANFLEIIVCKDRTGDIPEQIYTVVKDFGLRGPRTEEITSYLDYVHKRSFK